MTLTAIRYQPGLLELLDQRVLPAETRWLACSTAGNVAWAITNMVVRGAPAIAIAAAYGLALCARAGGDLGAARAQLAVSRPTAVNLAWALRRMASVAEAGGDLEAEAGRIHSEDLAINRRLGGHGAGLLTGGVLTICNTGALATGGHGTALGMVRSALAAGTRLRLVACETRPFDQGARLTSWECVQDDIPCTMIADSMAAMAMQTGRVNCVVVGADRVARNGDTANKIGTYGLAVLARHHQLPFFVAMPSSTWDGACPNGDAIPIEERAGVELFDRLPLNPPGFDAWNPAFDVTPAALVTAWVSEHGVARSPNELESLMMTEVSP